MFAEYGGESWKQYNEILYDMLNRLQVFSYVLWDFCCGGKANYIQLRDL